MLFASMLTKFRTSEKLNHLMCMTKFLSPHCYRFFKTGQERLSSKKCEKRQLMFTQRKPIKPVFMEPQGKVVIITGGTTGIGIAVAHELLHAGAQVVICAGSGCSDETGAVQVLKDKFGKRRARYVMADTMYERDVQNLFQYAIANYRKIDILFNNAGVWNDGNWEDCIDINIGSAIRGTLMAFEYMAKGTSKTGRGGLVVNCGSTVAFDTLPSCPAYCASQHAIVGLSQCLGDPFHLKHNHLRVVTLCPGVTQTEISFKDPKRQHWIRLCEEDTNTCADKQNSQNTYSVARAFVYLVRHGQSGHHYVVDGAELTEVILPPTNELSMPLCRYQRRRLFGWL